MAGLRLEHIYKVYPNGTKAVSDFTMDIKDQEFIVFVGPSGCGKSTTLRMIAGLEEISSGELYIDGILVNTVAPKDRDIAMVFQNYALYPHMTVYDNMAFGLKLRKMPKEEIDRRVREAAAMHTPAMLIQDSTAAEIIDNDVNGFLTPNDVQMYADRIVYLMEHPEVLKQVGKKASTTISRSWENVIEEVCLRYRDIQNSYKIKRGIIVP